MTVLGDWDEELDPGEWWVVSQGSNGEGGKKGKKRKREKEGGTFRVPGELLFRTREEAERGELCQKQLKHGPDQRGCPREHTKPLELLLQRLKLVPLNPVQLLDFLLGLGQAALNVPQLSANMCEDGAVGRGA